MLFFSFLVVGCSDAKEKTNTGENTDWEPTKYETVNDLDGVTLIVKKGTVTSTGLTVVFDNTSDKHCIYGEFFLLEKKIEGSWYQVPIAIDGVYSFDRYTRF
ncbi:hypothetical protein H8B09_23065 [Paenibacillus sp. PR3]|uniref:Bacterial Ig-like domain-containing protein n=1 Tax=Paenibacillus terricola TaxID=2763503 RepID=A0ABR8N2M3_9BACL|nr:immunoglobulin-like domain-containing protein [Paenibacillus terricola]MBD3921667.1 hypothetical protein [Paenibacillus terricola]